jgi:hypothetical protein
MAVKENFDLVNVLLWDKVDATHGTAKDSLLARKI